MKSKVVKFSQALERSPALRIVAAGVFIVILTFSLRALNSGSATAPDFAAGNPGKEVSIEVMPGESGSEIAIKLERAGVVKSSLAFFRVAVSDPRSQRIAPGEHLLQTQIPATKALDQLLDPKRMPNLIVVRDGARWNEIRESLINFGLSEVAISKAVNEVALPERFVVDEKKRNVPINLRLEGFLYPAQYSFNKEDSAQVILQKMVDRFAAATSEVNWRASNDLLAYDRVVIASLIQGEGTPDVFGKVSRVIYNRLNIGMPLQFDSTVHYALNLRGDIRLSLAETKVPSRYNTYLNRGLPPTAIGSPTISAIQASLNPTPGDWLYFVTVKPGETRFTASYDEFLDWKAEYRSNYRKGLFE